MGGLWARVLLMDDGPGDCLFGLGLLIGLGYIDLYQCLYFQILVIKIFKDHLCIN